jgi:peptidoglycan hydrolase-like protein with peptidoglycan-binding domain
MSTYRVKAGDTLSAIAARHKTTVAALAKANGISNVNVIRVGQQLRVPDGFTPSAASLKVPSSDLQRGARGASVQQLQGALVRLGCMSQAEMNTGPGIFGPRTEAALKRFQSSRGIQPSGTFGPTTRAALTKALAGGASAPAKAPAPAPTNNQRAADSGAKTPLYAQGDSRWGNRTLGRNYTIRAAGCAMTSTAMAISKISGKPINPGELDAYLDKKGGYYGDGIVWDVAAHARGLHATRPAWSLSTIDANQRAGKPVVIGVDYKAGSNGGANGTDHWITVVGRKTDNAGKVCYVAHDPAGGKVIYLYPSGGRLKASNGYKSTGLMIAFSK